MVPPHSQVEASQKASDLAGAADAEEGCGNGQGTFQGRLKRIPPRASAGGPTVKTGVRLTW